MNVFLAQIADGKAYLTQEESWHCVKVLRRKVGDTLQLIDGHGNFYEGKLAVISDKRSEVVIGKGPIQQFSKGYSFHLAFAPTKQNDRMEWLVEKAVEIGIDRISFVQCKNSERTKVNADRMRKIVVSAVKQSMQALIPEVDDLLPFGEFVKKAGAEQRLIAHCADSEKQDVKSMSFKGTSTLVLIGPEGDFTTEEIQLALNYGFKGLSFGANRLRTETAALCAVQAAALL